jgi:hypothetical protein
MNGINPNAGYGFWKRLLSNRGRSLLFGKPVFLPNESPTAVSATGYNVPLAANPVALRIASIFGRYGNCG